MRRLDEAVAAAGLLLRGGFHPKPEDQVPALSDGRPVGTLLLLGNAGPALWTTFGGRVGDDTPNPLDRWTRAVVTEIARAHGATPLFPFDGPPHLPFQRWAMRAEPVTPSPLGLLIHPDYGLWHAYRGALCFAERLGLPAKDRRPAPCESCAERPCLAACPVGAFTGEVYDVAGCRAHLRRPAGADCMTQGCRARRACPVGREHAYRPGQAAFHMRAFRDGGGHTG